MRTRAIAGLFWFLATWVGYEIVWSIAGTPRVIGPILAFLVASILVVDPAGRFWARSQTRDGTPHSGKRVGGEPARG